MFESGLRFFVINFLYMPDFYVFLMKIQLYTKCIDLSLLQRYIDSNLCAATL